MRPSDGGRALGGHRRRGVLFSASAAVEAPVCSTTKVVGIAGTDTLIRVTYENRGWWLRYASQEGVTTARSSGGSLELPALLGSRQHPLVCCMGTFLSAVRRTSWAQAGRPSCLRIPSVSFSTKRVWRVVMDGWKDETGQLNVLPQSPPMQVEALSTRARIRPQENFA